MKPVPTRKKSAGTQVPSTADFSSDLAFEAALGYYSPEELCLKFNITAVQWEGISRSTDFTRAVTLYRREIDEEGTEFKIKARKFATIVLDDLLTIATDQDASHADRISAIRELSRLAGYGKDDQGANVNNGFQVVLNMGGG